MPSSGCQDEARTAKSNLAVWLTLPVAPQGMPDEALGVIEAMLRANVDLAGVNLMTMDYGSSRPADRDMVDATGDALRASERQLDSMYRRAGKPLSRRSVWRKLGMTPMIGQNDTITDRVTVADARRLIDLSRKLGLGRVSMWSLNRDTRCGAQLDPGLVSPNCSGVDQKPLAFTYVFDQLPGRAARAAAARTSVTTSTVRDDPATSPYAIWIEDKVYEQGDKVTWHRGVYEAKWWSTGDVPDAAVAHEWDTPWRYLGPVMPGDHPAPVIRLPKGTYQAWKQKSVYVKGQCVEVNGVGYEAQWWTRGEKPDPNVSSRGTPRGCSSRPSRTASCSRSSSADNRGGRLQIEPAAATVHDCADGGAAGRHLRARDGVARLPRVRRRARAAGAAVVEAIASLREPRTTMGGVNLVAGFRPELWREAAPDDAPDG